MSTASHGASGRSDPRPEHRSLKILEIGADLFFARAAPDQTEFYWTGIKRKGFASRALGPRAFVRSLMKLRRGEFDLLVIHPPLYSPWHPRSLLTALRDWNWRAPLGLFAMFAQRWVHWFHETPIVVVDLDDSCVIGSHNDYLFDRCRAYFKRELPSDHWLAFCNRWYPKYPGRNWRSWRRNQRRIDKLRPISLGPAFWMSYDGLAESPQKTADIFFVGAVEGNSTVRSAGLPELRELQDEGYVLDIPDGRLDAPAYLRRLAAAWLAWSPGGLGWDCYRHYEAPLAGTVPLISNPTILRYRPLRDGDHAFYYAPEPGGLAEAARKALADKPRLRKMAQAARSHVRAHHVLRARAEHIAAVVLGHRLDGGATDPND
jgi:hypothetical protein